MIIKNNHNNIYKIRLKKMLPSLNYNTNYKIKIIIINIQKQKTSNKQEKSDKITTFQIKIQKPNKNN